MAVLYVTWQNKHSHKCKWRDSVGIYNTDFDYLASQNATWSWWQNFTFGIIQSSDWVHCHMF